MCDHDPLSHAPLVYVWFCLPESKHNVTTKTQLCHFCVVFVSVLFIFFSVFSISRSVTVKQTRETQFTLGKTLRGCVITIVGASIYRSSPFRLFLGGGIRPGIGMGGGTGTLMLTAVLFRFVLRFFRFFLTSCLFSDLFFRQLFSGLLLSSDSTPFSRLSILMSRIRRLKYSKFFLWFGILFRVV